MEPTSFSAGAYPDVDAAMASLTITDPNPFRAARAPGARALYDALKAVPLSKAVTLPEAMPVATAPGAELVPIFEHLAKGGTAAGPAFPRGATFRDGRLDMCKQVVGPEFIGDLAQAVRRGGATARIEHFLIGNNVVGDAGAADIADMVTDPDGPHLKTLYLAGNAFGPAGAKALSDALAQDQSVRALWLKRNPLGPEGGRALGEMLAQNTSIETLDLVNTGLMDAGVEALFDGLARNRVLRTLYLDANGLGPRSAAAMARYFKGIEARGERGLTGIFLGINRLGCDGAQVLTDALGTYGLLERLDLGANRIETGGLAATLAMARVMPGLKYLGLGLYKSASDMGELPNWFGDAGAAMVADHIAARGGPEAIEIKDTHIGPDGLAMLGDALEQQSAVLELSAAQYGLKQPALFHRIERFLERNVQAKLGIGLAAYRNGPLRIAKHGPDIDDIASIYRNVM